MIRPTLIGEVEVPAKRSGTARERVTGGHLFVIAGDVTRLHCDAWLLPTDDKMTTHGDFARVMKRAGGRTKVGGWKNKSQMFRELTSASNQQPQVWLGRIGGTDEDASHYADCAEAFVKAAAPSARRRKLTGRPLPLLALPVLGTRFGGGRWEEKGKILEALIDRLIRVARSSRVDIALVTWGPDRQESLAMYSAAQRARRLVLESDRSLPGWDLGPKPRRLEQAASSLAALAKSGRLVLFVGAGVSAGAGLPTWQRLLDDLAKDAKLSARDRVALRNLDFRDQATVIMRHVPAYREKIAAAFANANYPLTGALLASLPTTEAITTNYDDLFETAVTARREELVVLPYGAVTEPHQRWLLKLHGSIVDDAKDIVLTRDDYLGAPSRHAALFGLVQAMLLTRHMLFVGYSLSDEDFHKIVHEVRTARSGVSDAAQAALGSALVLADDPLQGLLWEGAIDVVPCGPRIAEGAPDARSVTSTAARSLQIFLDRVAFLAADMSAFLLVPGFGDLLDGDEKQLADLLVGLAERAPRDPGLRAKLNGLLEQFGSPTPEPG